MAAEIPAAIGRYTVDGKLGEGAMGVIYSAHDPAIDRPVAIKLVRADLLSEEDRAEYVERFGREARAAGRCIHPNIVAVFDFATHEGNPYLVMELVDGITLAQLLEGRGPIPAAQAIGLGGQMLDGLGAAHAQGIVHRDVKPANVMLTRGGQVKVADFGISRVGSVSMTHAGAVIGTPSYMSPEQCRGGEVDARTDVFSAGVVLFELLSGVRPFPGASAHEIWYKLVNEEPQDLAALCPGVPAGLAATIRRSLAKAPAQRFPDAAAMAAALRAGDAGDATMVLRSTAAAIDPAMAEGLVRRLASHVGPIAQRLVQSAIAKGGTLDAVCATLATSIPKAADRQLFLEQAIKGSGGVAATGGIAKEAQDRVAKALATHLGPVATLLVRKHAPGCQDAAELALRVAGHIDAPGERAAFLAGLGA